MIGDPMKTALFDLDGTLIDSAPGIFASIDAMLRSLGHTPDPDVDLTWMVGPPLDDAIAQLLAPYHDTRTTEAMVLYRTHYGAEGMLLSTFYPGVTEMLDAFAAAGWTLFVVTSKREVFARAILERLGVDQRFRAIHGTIQGGGYDSKPVLLRSVLERYAIDRAAAVMVGDRIHDYVAASENHVASVAVAWGYGTPAEFARADVVVSERAEVLPAATALLQE